MTQRVVSVGPDASIADAARLMLEHRVSGLPVLNEAGELVGIVTERDLLRHDGGGRPVRRPEWLEFVVEPQQLPRQWHDRPVAEVMTPAPVTIPADASVEAAGRLMEQHRVKRLPVMRANRVVGIIARSDLVRALAYGLLKTAAKAEDAARRARMIELEKQFWVHRSRPPT